MLKIDNGNCSKLGFHEGEVFLRVAATYKTLLAALLEQVQNAIDEEARNICIFVDQLRQTLEVRDDGNGVSQKKFEKAIAMVGITIKKKEKLGRFGLGVISPLGKCEKMFFISTPKNKNKGFIQWAFSTADIKKQEKLKEIPWVERKDLIFSRKNAEKNLSGAYVDWRTCVRMENYTEDRVIGKLSLASIKEGILDQFGPTIRRKKVVINVEFVNDKGSIECQSFTADDFTGKKLPEKYLHNQDVGQVIFRFFIAQSALSGGNKRKGKISLGELNDEFRFPMTNFLRVAKDYLSAEVVEALRSGFFEGEILAEKCQLQASRKNFEVNDAFLGLCLLIEAWYKKVGKNLFQEVKEQRAENRYQQLGLRSMKAISALVKSDPKFKELISRFKTGSIGDSHADPDAKVNGPRKGKSKAIQGRKVNGDKTPPHGDGDSSGEKKPRSESEHPDHMPITVNGPNGVIRTKVYDNSLGLELSHEPLVASSRLWKLDAREGILKLNTKHPLWDLCDTSDTTLMKFQEFLIIQALTIETYPEEDGWKEISRAYAEELAESYAYLLLNADKLAGRRASKKN